jgi:hypothetical protein
MGGGWGAVQSLLLRIPFTTRKESGTFPYTFNCVIE